MRRILYLAIGVLALLLVACGGDDSAKAPAAAAPEPAAEAAAAPEPEAAAEAPAAPEPAEEHEAAPAPEAAPTPTSPPAHVEPTGTVLVALPTFGREGLDPGAGINDDMSYYIIKCCCNIR